MKIDEKATAEARERHEEGTARLDAMFAYNRERDGNGFLLLNRIKFWTRPTMRIGQHWRPGK